MCLLFVFRLSDQSIAIVNYIYNVFVFYIQSVVVILQPVYYNCITYQ